MDPSSTGFLCGIELECQAFLEDGHAGRPDSIVLGKLLAAHFRRAPSLGARGGIFNAYGRVYLDWGHYELATAECASPYDVPGVLERQELLLADALAQLRGAGRRLRLANNNHSGLLNQDAPTWGAHESYLTERDPSTFGAAILPFLCTRLYAGAGGVSAVDGSYLAGVRCHFMELDEGGLTTGMRAIHSTSRHESLAGTERPYHRYHLILGDGQRSQFALALKLGATLLALRAAFHSPGLSKRVYETGFRPRPHPRGHLAILRELNVLSRSGRPARAHPLALAVQRVYLEEAERWAEACPRPPAWVERCLEDWRATLSAMERDEADWLRARLDAFAKHALMGALLAEEGVAWEGLGSNLGALAQLALLDHDYHELGRPDGLFRRLELSGLLAHRVAPLLEPGDEPEPFVPALGTRAEPRARVIRERAHDPSLICDWSCIMSPSTRRWIRLGDPFACAPGAWEALDPDQLARFELGGAPPAPPAEPAPAPSPLPPTDLTADLPF